ncbi:MAG: PRD domain-containing protein [Merdibacter sp.]
MLEAVKVKYPKAYQCAEKIRAFIESEYGYEFDRSKSSLSVHINRIVKNL